MGRGQSTVSDKATITSHNEENEKHDDENFTVAENHFDLWILTDVVPLVAEFES